MSQSVALRNWKDETQQGGSWAGGEEDVLGPGRGPVGQGGGTGAQSCSRDPDRREGPLPSCQRPAGVWARDSQRLGGSRSPGERPFLGPEFNPSSTVPGRVPLDQPLMHRMGLQTPLCVKVTDGRATSRTIQGWALRSPITRSFMAEPCPALGLPLQPMSQREGRSLSEKLFPSRHPRCLMEQPGTGAAV